ncbi:uncharacterized protein LOC101894632 [Musca domestica]|uniref:Uncharacterized protein LOC101894632 n=1 Tax=Musca domestica TaxID=7370 RepID=A0A1I8N483_MUSDO|nr:uncharacterized protein LOC101894632 [Musca domestica]
MKKVWHKPLHTRKKWKEMSVGRKVIYYMRPFVENLIEVWLEPLPFPTIFKIFYTCVIIFLFFLMLPILYPIIVVICFYGLLQYFVQSTLQLEFPRGLNIIGFVQYIFALKISNESYEEILKLYMDKYRYGITALASCVDYIRLAITVFWE